jgi:MFS transporter, DHA1 family, inner membrane transport protein
MSDSARRQLALLLTLSTGALLSSASSIGITPFLLDMARDLETDLGAAGNLVALQSVSWGVASVFAGAASDRYGRRPILSVGLLLLAICGIGVAFAHSYLWVAAWRVLSGFGGGAYMGAVFATVADHVPAAQRGRSLGWVVTGQSLALVLGVPAMTLAGAAFGWRGAVLAQACTLLVGTGLVWLAVPPAVRHVLQKPLSMQAMTRLVGPRVLALLLAGTSERVCFSAMAVYLPAFLLTRFGIDPLGLAIGLALVAVGNLVGNLAGGQLTDRVRAPQLLVATSMGLSGVVAVPALVWSPTIALAIGLAFSYTLLNAASRAPLLTLLSHVSAEARGAVLGLNVTFASIGWVGATALGGYVVAVAGFGALGVLVFVFGTAGAVLSLLHWMWPTLIRARLATVPE